MKLPIRVGIIGTGFGVIGHLASFEQIGGYQVVAIAGRDLEKTRKIAKEHQIAASYDDYRQLLANTDTDIVAIASPNTLHKEMFLAALPYKKHIILEKPAGIDSTEIQEMLDKSAGYPKLIIVDHELRFNPYAVRMKEFIDAQDIGEVKNIQLSNYSGYGSDPDAKKHWYRLRKHGGGQTLLIGTHLIDLGRFLVDLPGLAYGNLVASTVQPKRKTPDGEITVDVDEQITGNMMLSNGTNLSFFNTTFGFGYKNFEIRVLGTKGVLLYDEKSGLFISHSNKQPLTSVEIADPLSNVQCGKSFISSSFKYLAARLLHHLSGGKESFHYCTLREAYDNMVMLEKLAKH